jgi:hypothetical protein
VIFVLLFRYVFGGATHTGGVAYVDFLMPGIIVQTAIFGALLTGIGLTEDLKAGVVDRFRSLPIARSEVLLGRTAADAMINILTLIVMLLVGVAVGFRPSEPVYDLALAFALVLGFSYVFSWISAFIGLSVRDPETASSAGFVWVFPLTFASSAFVPVSSMPGVVRAVRGDQPRNAGRRCQPGPDHRARRRPRTRPRDPRVASGAAARVRAPRGAGIPAGVNAVARAEESWAKPVDHSRVLSDQLRQHIVRKPLVGLLDRGAVSVERGGNDD